MKKLAINNEKVFLKIEKNRVVLIFSEEMTDISEKHSNLINCYCDMSKLNEVSLYKIQADIFYERALHGHGFVSEKLDKEFIFLAFLTSNEIDFKKMIEEEFREKTNYGYRYIPRYKLSSKVNLNRQKNFRLLTG